MGKEVKTKVKTAEKHVAKGDDTIRTDIQGLFEMSREMGDMIVKQQDVIDRLRGDVLELKNKVRVLELKKGVIGKPSQTV